MRPSLRIRTDDVISWLIESSCQRPGGVVDHTLKLCLRVDRSEGMGVVRAMIRERYLRLEFDDPILQQRARSVAPPDTHVWKSEIGFGFDVESPAWRSGPMTYDITLVALYSPEEEKELTIEETMRSIVNYSGLYPRDLEKSDTLRNAVRGAQTWIDAHAAPRPARRKPKPKPGRAGGRRRPPRAPRRPSARGRRGSPSR